MKKFLLAGLIAAGAGSVMAEEAPATADTVQTNLNIVWTMSPTARTISATAA